MRFLIVWGCSYALPTPAQLKCACNQGRPGTEDTISLAILLALFKLVNDTNNTIAPDMSHTPIALAITFHCPVSPSFLHFFKAICSNASKMMVSFPSLLFSMAVCAHVSIVCSR